MKKFTQIMVLLIIMSIVTPNIFAKDYTEKVNFNGIYRSVIKQSVKYKRAPDFSQDDTQQETKVIYLYTYFRFFPDGSVTAHATSSDKEIATDKESDIYVKLEKPKTGIGQYIIADGRINFTLSYLTGAIEYTGVIENDKIHLEYHSGLTNIDGHEEYGFIEIY